MNFITNSGPHIKSTDNTSKIMLRLLMALIPIICFALYKNSFLVYLKGNTSLLESLHPLFMILTGVFTSVMSELLFVRFILKKKGIELKEVMSTSYAIFPGLFLALIIPINTPLVIVFLGSFFATIIGKMLFGGFGHNIFNPALIGSLFVITSYGSLIASKGGYSNTLELDTIGGATPLSNLSSINYVGSYDLIVSKFGDFYNFIFGTIPGTLGETNKFLIIVALVFLCMTKVIKWRIPVLYISTVFIMTMIIGLNNGMGMWYPLFHILSGSILFGAVFMATDPVTSPITKSGQILYGICLGILTVTLRFLTNYPEGVLTSILTMNMLVLLFDKLGVKVKLNINKFIIPLSIMIFITLGISYYIQNSIKVTDKPVDNENVKILEKKKVDNKYIYTVTTKGWGVIKANVEKEFGKVISIEIIDSSTETQWSEIEKNDYINKLIREQDNIENIDTISGTTRSSKALKDMIIKIIENNED